MSPTMVRAFSILSVSIDLLIGVRYKLLVPTHTVGVQSIDATIKIYGTRAAGRDSRLDFVFPLRSKRKADDIAAAEEAARIEALGEEKETGPSNPDSDKKVRPRLLFLMAEPNH